MAQARTIYLSLGSNVGGQTAQVGRGVEALAGVSVRGEPSIPLTCTAKSGCATEARVAVPLSH